MTPEEERYKAAQKRVKAKKEFYNELYVFMGFAGLYVLLNARGGGRFWWLIWVLFGLGISLIFNYVKAFGVPGVGVLDKDWEEREVERELEQMRRKAAPPEDERPLDLKPLDKQKPREGWRDDELV